MTFWKNKNVYAKVTRNCRWPETVEFTVHKIEMYQLEWYKDTVNFKFKRVMAKLFLSLHSFYSRFGNIFVYKKDILTNFIFSAIYSVELTRSMWYFISFYFMEPRTINRCIPFNTTDLPHPICILGIKSISLLFF